MTNAPEYLKALGFTSQGVGATLSNELHLASGKPVRVVTNLPLFSESTAVQMMEQLMPHVIIIDAGVPGYNVRAAAEIRAQSKNPIMIVGLAGAGSSDKEDMLGIGLDAVYTLPLNAQILDQMCHELPLKFEEVSAGWKKGAWSSVAPDAIRAAAAQAGGASWERSCIAVWSPKGGVGKTTIGIESAAALAAIGGRKVALVDANMNGGHVRIRLDVMSENNILSVATAYSMSHGHESLQRDLNNKINDSMVKVKGCPNLSVLTGITNMEQSRNPSLASKQGIAFIRYLLSYLRRTYDFVIVDMGSSINVGVHSGTFDEADKVLVVTTPDMTSIVDAKQGVHNSIIPEYGLQLDRFGLVINDWQDNLGITLDKAAEYTQIPAIGVIPMNIEGLVTKAGNEGRSFVAHYASNKDNPPSVERTLNGFVSLAAHFYPPVGTAWGARDKVSQAKAAIKGGLFGRGRK